MPNFTRINPAVSWPSQEGTLGVVGLAPWATLEFCRLFIGLFPALKDWEYPRLIVDFNPKIPSRGRFLELGESDPSPFIRETIQELSDAGATVAVVPCNTAHIMFDTWADSTSIPVINIVEVTSNSALRGGITEVVVLSGNLVASKGIYRENLERLGIEFIALPEEIQKLVDELIREVKIGNFEKSTSFIILRPILDYVQNRQIKSVILGCTELGLFLDFFKEIGLNVVDSTMSLAEAAKRFIQSPS